MSMSKHLPALHKPASQGSAAEGEFPEEMQHPEIQKKNQSRGFRRKELALHFSQFISST